MSIDYNEKTSFTMRCRKCKTIKNVTATKDVWYSSKKDNVKCPACGDKMEIYYGH